MPLKRHISKLTRKFIPKISKPPPTPYKPRYKEYRVALIGFKTSQCEARRMILGNCICSYDKTMQDDWGKMHTIDGEEAGIEIYWENQPINESDTFTTWRFRDVDGVIFFFCVGCRESYDTLVQRAEESLEAVRRLSRREVMGVQLMSTVGGSCEDSGKMAVTQEEGEDLGKKIGCGYLASVPTNQPGCQNWDQGILDFIDEIHRKKTVKVE